MQAAQQALDRRFGVVLHETHVGQHGGGADLVFQLSQLPLAQGVGGNLRGEIGQVLLRVARRLGVAGQPGAQFGFQQASVAHDQQPSERQPSWSIWRLLAGIEPGLMPPTSA
jgi:hypothetical protein